MRILTVAGSCIFIFLTCENLNCADRICVGHEEAQKSKLNTITANPEIEFKRLIGCGPVCAHCRTRACFPGYIFCSRTCGKLGTADRFNLASSFPNWHKLSEGANGKVWRVNAIWPPIYLPDESIHHAAVVSPASIQWCHQ